VFESIAVSAVVDADDAGAAPTLDQVTTQRTPIERTAVKNVDRRMFLASLAGAGALVAFGTKAVGSAPSGRALVWRLDSHWGYPSGKRGATHCKCRACVSHATNKVFASQAEAHEGRAHDHCVCQVHAVQVHPSGYEALFPDGRGSTDLRDGKVAEIYRGAIVHGGAST
jgi:hypothetical protein